MIVQRTVQAVFDLKVIQRHGHAARPEEKAQSAENIGVVLLHGKFSNLLRHAVHGYGLQPMVTVHIICVIVQRDVEPFPGRDLQLGILMGVRRPQLVMVAVFPKFYFRASRTPETEI